jgi:hypothetical protein
MHSAAARWPLEPCIGSNPCIPDPLDIFPEMLKLLVGVRYNRQF